MRINEFTNISNLTQLCERANNGDIESQLIVEGLMDVLPQGMQELITQFGEKYGMKIKAGALAMIIAATALSPGIATAHPADFQHIPANTIVKLYNNIKDTPSQQWQQTKNVFTKAGIKNLTSQDQMLKDLKYHITHNSIATSKVLNKFNGSTTSATSEAFQQAVLDHAQSDATLSKAQNFNHLISIKTKGNGTEKQFLQSKSIQLAQQVKLGQITMDQAVTSFLK